jgi:hypothetical protein
VAAEPALPLPPAPALPLALPVLALCTPSVFLHAAARTQIGATAASAIPIESRIVRAV